MKQPSFLIVPLLFLTLTACESTIVEPPLENDSQITFEFLGGLSISFQSEKTVFEGAARLFHLTATATAVKISRIH